MTVNKTTILFLLSAIFATNLVAAVSTQTEEIGVSATEVAKLIKVSASLSFENLIPGQEYSAPVTVEWAVPDSGLANINEEKIIVRVNVERRVQDSWIYFKRNGVKTSNALLEIYCVVEGGKCSTQSKLAEAVVAYYSAPFGAQYPHEDGLRVSAFLIPLQQAEEELVFEGDAQEKIGLTEQKINDLQLAGALQAAEELKKLVSEARELLAEKKFGELKAKVALLEGRLEEALKQAEETLAENAGQAAQFNPQKEQAGKGGVIELQQDEPAKEDYYWQGEGQKNVLGTGFVINSKTAAAAAAVALLMAALVAFAALYKNRQKRVAKARRFFDEDGEHSMGSGGGSLNEYAPYGREKFESDPMDKWAG